MDLRGVFTLAACRPLPKPAVSGDLTPAMSNTYAQQCRVIRRNGQVVNWNQNKIEIAIRKAFLSEQMDSQPAVDIALLAARRVSDEGKQMIHIEELQDLVQEELMKGGHYTVAALDPSRVTLRQ